MVTHCVTSIVVRIAWPITSLTIPSLFFCIEWPISSFMIPRIYLDLVVALNGRSPSLCFQVCLHLIVSLKGRSPTLFSEWLLFIPWLAVREARIPKQTAQSFGAINLVWRGLDTVEASFHIHKRSVAVPSPWGPFGGAA